MEPIRIFIGFDPRESVAWHTLVHSIMRHATTPLQITPLALPNLTHIYWRPRDPLQSTDFSFSRFLVPYLSEYQGWSLFMDCDMLVRDDITQLWALRDDRYAVMCVQHDHHPRETVKFLGATQTRYAKKNWSSVMLFNNPMCRALTPEYVNTASGLDLHQFRWLGNDSLIGSLPADWNHLVGYDPPNPQARNVHFTIGGPYFHEYRDCEFADEWREEHARANHVEQRHNQKK
ncbi:glycosyltransferase [Tepidimonas charontis]|uniref:Glycosyltransferase n=1 Tax=Tepidimonas charontis TaxID=2267262 RepID=A0A554XK64_9BURK|nr:glycosyltransferase [Tepidimonas charontis]TSE36209.1 hypothetical protein Tchar_00260 [Tepidimonas charontis]